MKSKFTLALALCLMFLINTFSQSPNSFKYQSMIRKTDGSALATQTVKLQISILKGSTSGTSVYSEVHSITSNSFGVISLNIGEGLEKVGVFSSIDWSVDSYFVKIEMDETGGSNFTLSSISQLLSVPFALHANSVSSVDWSKLLNKPNFFSGSYNDLTNKPTLFSGSYSDLSNKPMILNFSGSYNDLTNKPNLTDSISKYEFSGSYDSLKNKPSLFDGQYNSLSGKPTFATVAMSGNYNNLIDKPTIDGSETKLSAGSNISITGSGTTASPYVINSSSSNSNHYIGELFGGGIIFYVDNAGQHGLICSLVDLSVSQVWSNVDAVLIGVLGQSDWDGQNNTTAIISQSSHISSAAKLCDDYSNSDYGTGTFTDWYLPSLDQLSMLYKNKYIINQKIESDGSVQTISIGKKMYWSSTEQDGSYSWGFIFGDGNADDSPKSDLKSVRAIRSF